MSKDASARLAAGTGSQRSQGALRSAERIVIGMCGILVYGLLHMLLLVYPMNFEIHRAFPFGISSLPFLAVVAGLMLGGLRLVRQSRLGEDKAWITSPEHSLSATASGIYTLSTGLFIFAWTSHRDTSPWPQISSGVLIGYGIMAVLAPALVCLVDESSADMFGLSIYAFLQSVTASVAPLLVIPMYQKLGVRTASNSLATLCLVVALLFSLYLRQSRR